MADKQLWEVTPVATDVKNDDGVIIGGQTAGTRYAPLTLIANFVHNLWAAFINALTAKTSFASGDKIPVVNGSTATAMSKDTLLELTAQNALAGNVAPAFDPDKEGGYKKFEKVVYGGIVYKAKNDIAEGTPWSAADWNAIGIANYNLKDYGNVANTEDLNDFKNPGIYYVEDNTANAPVSGSNSRGWLVVFGTSNIADQIFIRIYNGEIYKRVFRSGSWNDWSTTFAGYSYYKGAMPSTIDTNYAEGLWSVVKSAGVAIGGTYPSDIDTTKAMHLLVEVGSVANVQNYVYQTLFNLDTKRYYYRTRISSAWSDWISIASESFCTKYTDDEILKATNEFALIYPYFSANKLFDTEGNEVSSNFYSYYYNVTEGDVIKVNLGVFSSSNFSVVSLWKNGSFVKSLVNSPTTSGEFLYKITEDADTMIVSYFANATYKALANTNYADVPKPNLLVLPNSLTHKGITFSVGANGKVTLTGTSDAGSGSAFEIDVTLTKGQYILTGLPTTSNRYNYTYRIIRADSSYDDVAYTEYKQGYIFEVTSSTELVKIYIHVVGSVAIPEGGVVFEPILQSYPPFTLGFVHYGQPADVKHIYNLIDCSDFNWSGKKMNVIGDSIVEGKAGNWVTIIGNILHLSTARNYGIGGCRLSYYGDGGSVTADDSVVARYANMDDDADIVIVHAGTNDWASQVTLGNADSQSNLEFNGALNIIMDGLRAKYPTALVIFSAILDRVDYDSPTHGGASMPILTSAYSEAIKERCKEHKFVFFDGYTYCGLDFAYDYSHGNFVTNDGLHPNVGGAKIIGRKLAGFIKAH